VKQAQLATPALQQGSKILGIFFSGPISQDLSVGTPDWKRGVCCAGISGRSYSCLSGRSYSCNSSRSSAAIPAAPPAAIPAAPTAAIPAAPTSCNSGLSYSCKSGCSYSPYSSCSNTRFTSSTSASSSSRNLLRRARDYAERGITPSEGLRRARDYAERGITPSEGLRRARDYALRRVVVPPLVQQHLRPLALAAPLLASTVAILAIYTKC
jgi:hypothetical protein